MRFAIVELVSIFDLDTPHRPYDWPDVCECTWSVVLSAEQRQASEPVSLETITYRTLLEKLASVQIFASLGTVFNKKKCNNVNYN